MDSDRLSSTTTPPNERVSRSTAIDAVLSGGGRACTADLIATPGVSAESALARTPHLSLRRKRACHDRAALREGIQLSQRQNEPHPAPVTGSPHRNSHPGKGQHRPVCAAIRAQRAPGHLDPGHARPPRETVRQMPPSCRAPKARTPSRRTRRGAQALRRLPPRRAAATPAPSHRASHHLPTRPVRCSLVRAPIMRIERVRDFERMCPLAARSDVGKMSPRDPAPTVAADYLTVDRSRGRPPALIRTSSRNQLERLDRPRSKPA